MKKHDIVELVPPLISIVEVKTKKVLSFCKTHPRPDQ